MKTLLINPRYLAPDELRGRYVKYREWIQRGNMYVHPFEPPLGLAYIVSYLAERGHPAGLIDLQALDMDDAELGARLVSEDPGIVGITSMTTTYPSALRLARFVKGVLPGVKVAMGGVHPTIMPETVLKEGCVDYVIRGEGERPMLALAEGVPFDRVDGLSYNLGDGPVVRPKAAGLGSLDELPMPDYGSFPAERYIEYNQRLRGIRGISMLVSRGCPYHCAFCAVEGAMGRRYRLKDPAAAVDEMQSLKERFGIEGVWFKDSIFNLDKRWVKRFCGELGRRSLGMKWQMNTRVDLVEDGMIGLMASAGMVQVDLGIESGSQKTLDRLNKRITVEQIRKAVEVARRHVKVSGFFMIGVPGETMEDISKTFRLAKELDLDAYSFSIFVPLPGSDLYDELKDAGRLPEEPDYGSIHFTDTNRSYCDVPLEKLKEVFEQINEYFSCGPSNRAACVMGKT